MQVSLHEIHPNNAIFTFQYRDLSLIFKSVHAWADIVNKVELKLRPEKQ